MAEVLPLHVLLCVMRSRWKANDKDGAVALAKAAAPYVHGRPQHVRMTRALAEVPDDELDAWIGQDDEDDAAEEAGEAAEKGE